MLCSRQVALPSWRVALGASLFLSMSCGRLGFSERASDVRADDTHHTPLDAGGSPPEVSDDASLLFVLDPPDASLDAGSQGADSGVATDAAAQATNDAGQPDASLPPPPPPTDPACNDAFPTRLWPVASDVPSCTTSYNAVLSTTGPNSADYTVYDGCSTWLEFDTTGSSSIQVRAFGDSCICQNCSLWHVHYQLEEDLGSGLTPELEVQEPDDQPCVGGVEVNNYTSFTPNTSRVRMQTLAGSTGAGFYFVVCGAP